MFHKCGLLANSKTLQFIFKDFYIQNLIFRIESFANNRKRFRFMMSIT